MGVKNCTFADSTKEAAIYSLIQTAKLNDVDPQAWLADVLARLPDIRQGELKKVRKPALDLSDVVRQRGKLGTVLERIGGTVGRFAWPRRAVKPQRRIAARRRRGA